MHVSVWDIRAAKWMCAGTCQSEGCEKHRGILEKHEWINVFAFIYFRMTFKNPLIGQQMNSSRIFSFNHCHNMIFFDFFDVVIDAQLLARLFRKWQKLKTSPIAVIPWHPSVLSLLYITRKNVNFAIRRFQKKSKINHWPFISGYICPGTPSFDPPNLNFVPGSGPGTES